MRGPTNAWSRPTGGRRRARRTCAGGQSPSQRWPRAAPVPRSWLRKTEEARSRREHPCWTRRSHGRGTLHEAAVCSQPSVCGRCSLGVGRLTRARALARAGRHGNAACPAEQTSTAAGGGASQALGAGPHSADSCTKTEAQSDPWWRVDFGRVVKVTHTHTCAHTHTCVYRCLLSFHCAISVNDKAIVCVCLCVCVSVCLSLSLCLSLSVSLSVSLSLCLSLCVSLSVSLSLCLSLFEGTRVALVWALDVRRARCRRHARQLKPAREYERGRSVRLRQRERSACGCACACACVQCAGRAARCGVSGVQP